MDSNVYMWVQWVFFVDILKIMDYNILIEMQRLFVKQVIKVTL